MDEARLTVLAAGIYNLGFAVFHLAFWRLFQWPRSLAGSGPLNTSITLTLNIVLTYTFVVAGAMLIWCWSTGRDALLLMIAGAGFWFLRAALQPMLFDVRSRISQAMTLLFIAGGVLHAAPLVAAL